jgi:uncharacterized protein (DUF2062 family)
MNRSNSLCSAGTGRESKTTLLNVAYKKIKRRFIQTILRNASSPDERARGAFIGMFIAMTPTVGIQIILVSLCWSIMRFFKKFRFDFVVAFAMTWITNYITLIPFYFLFYYTGAMLGRIWGYRAPLSYSDFSIMWQPVLKEKFLTAFILFIKICGKLLVPLFVGSMPYAILFSVGAYAFTIHILKSEKAKRLKDFEPPAKI